MNIVDYLRISLIDRCNFQCQYCMPSGAELDYILKQNLLTKAEILTLLQEIFIPLGFRKFRLTGGEPLLRPDVVEIVREIASIPATEDLAITTNGFLLPSLAQPLYDAGLRRINISIDSLDSDNFARIIGKKGRQYAVGLPRRFPALGKADQEWEQTWKGIQIAHQIGFSPLKLNVVVIPGVNDQEILDLAALTIKQPWHIRFIEFMPIGNQDLFQLLGQQAWIPSAQLREQIRQHWGLIESQVQGNGPADVFKIPEAKGTIGFISQMSECFCDRCNRMRLSADGWLRPCLLNETGQINLKIALNQGVELKKIREQVAQLLAIKPEINYKQRDSGTKGESYSRTMSQIGG